MSTHTTVSMIVVPKSRFDMDPKPFRKRKRPVTSCGECYRRKQKCNRELPCSICVGRGVPEKCFFDGHFEEVSPPQKRVARDDPGSGADEVHLLSDASVPPADLSEQTGYSQANGNNFGILQAFLKREEATGITVDNESGEPLPSYILYQIVEIEKKLPPIPIQISLIDLYFDQCWWWYSSLEPALIKRMFNEWQNAMERPRQTHTKDCRYFPALLFQVLAIGLQYLLPEEVNIRRKLDVADSRSSDALSAQYSKAGMQIMDLLGRHNSAITAVQHDMLRGVWLKNLSRGTESWYSLGNAIRQAQELGLHREQELPLSIQGSAFDDWMWRDILRQRVWACLFSWDAHVSFTLGRPRIVNAKDCARMNILECAMPPDPSLELSDTPQESEPSFVTPVLFHYSLAYLIHEMLDSEADKPILTDYSVLDRLHGKLNAVQRELPLCFHPDTPDKSWDTHSYGIPAMRLHMASIANTYLVALHRAHVLRRPQSCKAAIDAATMCLEYQQQLFEVTDKQKWRIYTYSFYTIDSSIFLAALLLEQPSIITETEHGKILHALTQSLTRLELMQEVSPMAKTGAQIIGKCLRLIKKRKGPPSTVATLASPEDLPSISNNSNNTSGVIKPSSGSLQFRDLDSPASPSLRSWIEQMDQVMMPIMQSHPDGPFDNSLWDFLIDD